MGNISPINQPSQPHKAPSGGDKVEQGKGQQDWLMRAFFKYLQVLVDKGVISKKKAQEIEGNLSHLQGQLHQVSSQEELNLMFNALNGQLDIVNGEIKKYQAQSGGGKMGDILPKAEQVTPGQETSGTLSQIKTVENFLNLGTDQSVLDPSQGSILLEQTSQLIDAVQSGTLRKPNEAMAKLDNIVKQANEALPEKYAFPRVPLGAYDI